jgi:hypothetical protein
MMPMFDNRVSVIGIPADVIVLAVAVGAAIIGLLWLRRIVTIEPEVHSFRSTAGHERSWSAIAGVVALVALIALLGLVMVLALSSLRLP